MTQASLAQGKRRILFIAEAVTLAHVARPLSLARTLDPARYEIVFACAPRYNSLLDTTQLRLIPIRSIPSKQFLQSLANGQRPYSTSTLAAYMEEDLRIIEECQPDVIVGDFRLSLSVSARLVCKPYITISNAYWSPYATPRFTVPELPLVRYVGVRLGQLIFDMARPIVFAYHTFPLNRLFKQYGLPRLGLDLRRVYTEADYTLYADIPQLVPTYDLPDTHRYVGPTLWSPNSPQPKWWDSLPDNKPIIYVTLGTSGNSYLLPMILSALATVPVTVIAASAGQNLPMVYPANAYVADYLPGEKAAQRAALVISNGGSQTCYQAFAHGKPVIGIPNNMDQYLNMEYIRTAGAGQMIRSGKAAPDDITNSVHDLLKKPRYAEEARRLMQSISAHSPQRIFEEVLERAYTEQVASRKD